MMRAPPTQRKSCWWVSNTWPINEADAPNRINTVENPATNSSDIVSVVHFTRYRSTPRVNSSKDSPVTNDTYAGTNGSTQGETNERNPAENAIASDGVDASTPSPVDPGSRTVRLRPLRVTVDPEDGQRVRLPTPAPSRGFSPCSNPWLRKTCAGSRRADPARYSWAGNGLRTGR